MNTVIPMHKSPHAVYYHTTAVGTRFKHRANKNSCERGLPLSDSTYITSEVLNFYLVALYVQASNTHVGHRYAMIMIFHVQSSGASMGSPWDLSKSSHLRCPRLKTPENLSSEIKQKTAALYNVTAPCLKVRFSTYPSFTVSFQPYNLIFSGYDDEDPKALAVSRETKNT